MECPRCGFVQPEDRFCANCGLNIATYIAKPKPLTQRIAARPAFYGLLAVISVVILVQVIKRSETPPVERRGLVATEAAPVANTQSAQTNAKPDSPLVPGAARSNSLATKEESAAPAAASVAPSATALPENAAKSLNGDSGTAATAGAGTGAGAGAGAGAGTGAASTGSAGAAGAGAGAPSPKPPLNLELSFYEIGRESWVNLANEGKSTAEQNGWRALAFASKEKLVAALSSARRLPGQRVMQAQPSSSAMLHFPLGMSNPPLGLFMDFSVVKTESLTMEIDFAGQIDVKHEGAQESHQKAEFAATFNPQGALVLIGFIPRKPLPDPVANQLANSPLSAMESPDFLEGQSEVILVLQGR